MATKLTETLVDDLDGSEASETVTFTIGGQSYEIDLSARNTTKLDKILTPYKARRSTGRGTRSTTRRATATRSTGSKGKTLFSTLDADQKTAFRKWAKLPNARRIADLRVQEWTDAGKPLGGRAPVEKAAKRPAVRKKAASS